jgi:hypothetical protein
LQVSSDPLELSKRTNTELERLAREHPHDREFLSSALRVLQERKRDSAETTRAWIIARLDALPTEPRGRKTLYLILAVLGALGVGFGRGAGEEIWKTIWPLLSKWLGT